MVSGNKVVWYADMQYKTINEMACKSITKSRVSVAICIKRNMFNTILLPIYGYNLQ